MIDLLKIVLVVDLVALLVVAVGVVDAARLVWW